MAAGGAEAVAAAPFEHGLGGGRDAGVLGRHLAAGESQVVVLAAAFQRPSRWIGLSDQVDRVDGRLSVESQEQHGLVRARQLEAQPRLDSDKAQPAVAVFQQRLPVPEGDDGGRGVGPARRQPVGLEPQIAAPVERIAGVGVDEEG